MTVFGNPRIVPVVAIAITCPVTCRGLGGELKACQNHLRSPYYTSLLLGLSTNIYSCRIY